MYTFYILFSKSKTHYYIGFTGNSIEERLRKHNSNHKGFTGKTNDWSIVYSEKFDQKDMAMKREKGVKGWKSRVRVEKLIKGTISADIEHPDL